jgi:alpha-tubulin suppressor-like RCC1 family protein
MMVAILRVEATEGARSVRRCVRRGPGGRRQRACRLLSIVLLAGGVAAGAAVFPPRASGAALEIRISGLPEGRTGRVTVRGPNGYIRRVSASRTLRGLDPGRYRTSARSVRFAEYRYSPTVDRPTVRLRRAGRATVRVRYTFSGPSGAAAAISAGGIHACALTTGGAVKCWGYNARWQLGAETEPPWRSSTPVAVTDLATGTAAIDVGGLHSCALTTGGAPLCWGANSYGELGNDTGDDTFEPTPVTDLSSGIARISAGGSHTCVVTTAEAALCWGLIVSGQLGDGTKESTSTPVDVSGLSSEVRSISAGGDHTCAVTTAGSAWCWGYNHDGPLGDGTTEDRVTPVAVDGLTSGVVAISAGDRHTCALMSDRSVRCWGARDHGQLGDGRISLYPRSTPVRVEGLSRGVTSLSAGREHTCVVTTAGAAKCWGRGDWGQLGDWHMQDRPRPVSVYFLSSGVTAVAAGGLHSCAVMVTGAALCWGSNLQGELGNGFASGGGATLTPYVVVGFGA